MNTYAKFVSRDTSDGLKIFRHHTEFRSKNGPGEVIGLVVMMNPGEARPESDELFQKLQTEEFETGDYVATKPDKTMSKVIRMLKEAFAYQWAEGFGKSLWRLKETIQKKIFWRLL